MNLQLDTQLKAVFDEIVAHTPHIGPTPSPELSVASPASTRGPWLKVAAAAIALVGVSALVGLRSTRSTERGDLGSTSEQSVAPGLPALLEPTAGISVVERGLFDVDTPAANGAVIAPDGTVFGLGLVPTSPLDLASLPDSFEERDVAGLAAWAFVDRSAPDEIYRGFEVECATLSVTTAGEAMWSPDTELLAGSLRSAAGTLTLQLPDGWTSLGVTSMTETYHNSTLSVRVDGTDYQVRMTQAIGTPVGAFLSSMETNPVDLSDEDGPLWHVAGATTPGWNALAGTRHNTSFSISGDAPVDVLKTIVDSLTAVAAADWLELPTDPSTQNDGTDIAEEGTIPVPGCSLRQLTVTGE